MTDEIVKALIEAGYSFCTKCLSWYDSPQSCNCYFSLTSPSNYFCLCAKCHQYVEIGKGHVCSGWYIHPGTTTVTTTGAGLCPTCHQYHYPYCEGNTNGR